MKLQLFDLAAAFVGAAFCFGALLWLMVPTHVDFQGTAALIAIISSSFTGIVSLITAVTAFITRKRVEAQTERIAAANAKLTSIKAASDASHDVVDSKLNHITELTNSNLTTVKAQLTAANARIEKLEATISTLLPHPPPPVPEVP